MSAAEQRATQGEIAVSVEALTRSFGTRKSAVHAVRGISFEARRGELLGLVGPDAAGKTTTMRMLAGLVRPTSGSVRVLGVDPNGRGAARVRDSLGLVPQEHSLYGDLTVAENLSFFGELYGLSRAVFRERRERLLGISRLEQFTERRAAALSGGMYKKLALSCALLHQPEVLLLDEPTNGVDPPSRRELWDLVYTFVDRGMTVIVSTPYMDEAARCHRALLMHEGRVLAEGAPKELTRGLTHPCFVVELPHGLDAAAAAELREALHATLASLPAVMASSPAGARLKVVVEKGGEETVRRAIGAHGASLVPALADFEDLFLARVAEAQRADSRAQVSS